MADQNKLFAVLTTIQAPTEPAISLAQSLREIDGHMIVVGDQKGPSGFALKGVDFFSLRKQLGLDLNLLRELPTGHYARKNIGYLVAAARGASCIYETDDDNAPQNGWYPREETVAALAITAKDWVNVYRCFSDDKIWPRGFPLSAVRDSFSRNLDISAETAIVQAPIQQGLVNHSPDVDAVWRLVFGQPFVFRQGPSLILRPGAWCPFNSQSTWWFPVAYPLMYLPSHCSFRMTDIWRSFIAQRCLWELDLGIIFHAPEVVQFRNAHDSMVDFEDELPGYRRNGEMATILDGLALSKGAEAVRANMHLCYEALVAARFFPTQELDLVEAWLEDLEATGSR